MFRLVWRVREACLLAGCCTGLPFAFAPASAASAALPPPLRCLVAADFTAIRLFCCAFWRQDGRTALHLAAQEGHFGCVRTLIEELKADPTLPMKVCYSLCPSLAAALRFFRVLRCAACSLPSPHRMRCVGGRAIPLRAHLCE